MMEVDPKDVDFKALHSPQAHRGSLLQRQLQAEGVMEAPVEGYDPSTPITKLPLNPPAATEGDGETLAETVVTMMTKSSRSDTRMIPLDGAGGTSPFAAVARAAVEPHEDNDAGDKNTEKVSAPPAPPSTPMTPTTNPALLSSKYTPSDEVDNFVMVAMLKEAQEQRKATTPTIKNG